VGQKVNPIGFRVGITEGWQSRWYAPKQGFGTFVIEDESIRKFIDKELNRKPPFAAISRVEVERTRDEVKVILHTARPGVVIGAKGADVDKLKERIEDLIDRRVSVNIVEVKNPDLDARLVAQNVGEQLQKRVGFRRVMKQKCETALQNGARGIKIQCSGRLGGSEMARCETQMQGSIPLQTLQAEVDYAIEHCVTPFGTIGIKVWVYRGMYGEQPPEIQNQGGFRRRTRR
jgi:small subunit ribosomal protein S3